VAVYNRKRAVSLKIEIYLKLQLCKLSFADKIDTSEWDYIYQDSCDQLIDLNHDLINNTNHDFNHRKIKLQMCL